MSECRKTYGLDFLPPCNLPEGHEGPCLGTTGPEATGSPGNREQALRGALDWALDLINIYDKKLVEMGDPYASVYSDLHVAVKKKARAALAASEPASQDAQTGEPTLRSALELMVNELTWYAAKNGLGPARLQYALSQGERALDAAGQAAQPNGEDWNDIILWLDDNLSNEEDADFDRRAELMCEAFKRATKAAQPLQPQVEELRPYLRHLPSCKKREWECSQPACGETHNSPCTCGLDALIRKWLAPPEAAQPGTQRQAQL